MTDHAKKIGRQMAKGAAWMVVAKWCVRGIGIVSTIILARLLVPSDFGLVALAVMVFGLLEIMGEFGFDLALIQNQKAARRHYDTAWTLTVIRGAVIAAGLAVLAAPASRFFNDPRLEQIIYWLAVAALVDGAKNVGIVDFQKELNFHKEFVFLVATKMGSFVVTIALAFLWRDYWALVAGIIAARILRTALSYAMHPYRPRLSFAAWREIIHFVKWLLLNNMAVFVGTKFDTFLLGKFLGPRVVGLYDMAQEISHFATTGVVWPIGKALYPGYAKLAGNREQLAKSFVDSFSIILLIGLPCGVGIALIAEPLTKVFLGTKWLDVIPLIEILAIEGVVRVSYANFGSVFLAIGKPQTVTYLTIIALVIRLPIMVLGVMYAGAYGAAWALLVGAFLGLGLNLRALLPLLGVPLSNLGAAIWRSLVAICVMATMVYGLQELWGALVQIDYLIPYLALTVICGAGVYVSAHLTLWRLSGLPDGAERHLLSVLPFVSTKSHSK